MDERLGTLLVQPLQPPSMMKQSTAMHSLYVFRTPYPVQQILYSLEYSVQIVALYMYNTQPPEFLYNTEKGNHTLVNSSWVYSWS
jgi:hypothetical protein